VADLGAGAGFPGLPLAILFPERRFTLVEARERKHHFQREAVRRLRLENVQPLLGRSEALVAAPHEGVVAQAMAQPERAVPLLLAWAAVDGWLAVPGGSQPPALEAVPGVRDPEIRRYRIPSTGVERTLWIGRRAAGEAPSSPSR
jgi:16S rRNA (guanine527-N7)-methyltransferase